MGVVRWLESDLGFPCCKINLSFDSFIRPFLCEPPEPDNIIMQSKPILACPRTSTIKFYARSLEYEACPGSASGIGNNCLFFSTGQAAPFPSSDVRCVKHMNGTEHADVQRACIRDRHTIYIVTERFRKCRWFVTVHAAFGSSVLSPNLDRKEQIQTLHYLDRVPIVRELLDEAITTMSEKYEEWSWMPFDGESLDEREKSDYQYAVVQSFVQAFREGKFSQFELDEQIGIAKDIVEALVWLRDNVWFPRAGECGWVSDFSASVHSLSRLASQEHFMLEASHIFLLALILQRTFILVDVPLEEGRTPDVMVFQPLIRFPENIFGEPKSKTTSRWETQQSIMICRKGNHFAPLFDVHAQPPKFQPDMYPDYNPSGGMTLIEFCASRILAKSV